MSVFGKCSSCMQLDNVMLFLKIKKWLCDDCWKHYEDFEREMEKNDECNQCGSPFHSTFMCEYDEQEG